MPTLRNNSNHHTLGVSIASNAKILDFILEKNKIIVS